MKAILVFLKLPADQQLLLVKVPPDDCIRAAYELKGNDHDFVGIALNYCYYLQAFSSSDDFDVVSDDGLVFGELYELLSLMLASNSAELWKKASICRRPVWALVRRLSQIAFVQMGWDELSPDTELLAELSEIPH